MSKLIKSILLLSYMVCIANSEAYDAKLVTQVSDQSIKEVIINLKIANDIKPKGQPLNIELNSPGGSIFAGFELLNVIESIQLSGRKVNGVVTGMCASMCFAILQKLDRRLAYPHTILMQHLGSGGNTQALAEIERHIQEYEARRIKLPSWIWKHVCTANIWVMAPKALEYNIIDAIVLPKVGFVPVII